MAFKFEIGFKNRTAHLEAEGEAFIGKKIGEKADGSDINPDFAGYELEITGASDKAGFPSKKDVEGTGLKRVLLKKGFSLHKLKLKKKTANRKKIERGLRKRRTVRGNTISSDISQINLKVLKEGGKKFDEIFPKKAAAAEEKPAQ